jgi:hypothetical protein
MVHQKSSRFQTFENVKNTVTSRSSFLAYTAFAIDQTASSDTSCRQILMLVYYGMAGAGLVGRELRVRAIAITGFSGDAIIRIACAVLTPLTQPVFIFELIWSWRVALTPVPGAH